MDLDSPRPSPQLSLMVPERSATAREKRALEQFARDYAEQIHFVRAALGASTASPGAVK